MRAVAYCRVSTDREDQKNSLQNQIDYFSEYLNQEGNIEAECGVLCKKDKTLTPLRGIYADEGLTGTRLKNRQAFQQMISDAKRKTFDIIYTKSVARFGRSVEDTAKITKDLKELGIGVFFLDIKVNSLDNSKEFLINLFSALAQEESNNKSSSIQFGTRKAQQQGKWTTGNPPYGYDIVDGFLKINNKEANVIREIYDLYFNHGYGTSKIARFLMANKIDSKKNTKWSQITISRFLENPIYTGKQIQHTIQTTDVNRQIKVKIDKEKRIIHQFEHLRIIDQDLFELVQIEKQRRLKNFGEIIIKEVITLDDSNETYKEYKRLLKRGTGRYSGKHLFSNLLYCGGCGHTLKRKKRHTTKKRDIGYEWCCHLNDKYGKVRCPYRNSLTEDSLNSYIINIVNQRKLKLDDLKSDFEMYMQIYLNTSDVEDRIKTTQDFLVKLNKKRNINFDLYGDGDITKEEYIHRNKEIEEQLSEAKNELNKLQNIDFEIETLKLKYQKFIQELSEIDENNLTNPVLRRLISKLNVFTEEDGKKRIEVIWNFIDKSEEEIAEHLKGAF
ncbi:hypothetical protein EEL31_10590 [Brevibacillus laterosporus]|nr:recombinase family protein [Brevibacillus laterosporus]TPG68931.1 hypothetical protein EEL31_10590 [Brevibacillus laterosporus]